MKITQFEYQVKRLIEEYGPKYYGQSTIDEMWRMLASIDDVEFASFISNWLTRNDKAPTLRDFRQFSFLAKRRFGPPLIDEKAAESFHCSHCNDVGIVKVNSVSRDIDSLMRCDCIMGINHNSSIPIWNKKVEQILERIPCPIEWFKPIKKEIGTHSVVEINQSWNDRLTAAEIYWNHKAEEKRKREGA